MSAELQKLIQEMGETVHEFKQGVDERVQKLEKGEGLSAVEAKLEAINDKIDELEATKTRVEALETKANRIGRMEGDEAKSEYKTAFDSFLRKGREDGLAQLQSKATSVGTDADGGYAVPQDLDTMIGEIEREATPMRQVCSVMSVASDKYEKLFNLGGGSAGWVGETAARPETNTPTLAQILPTFGEIYANPASTQKSLDDVMFDVESWLAQEVAQDFAEQENLAFTSGNGTNKPTGILSATMALTDDATRAFGQIQYRLSGTDSALGANDDTSVNNLIDLTYDLRPGYRTGARWMLPRDLLRAVRKLRDSNGMLVWQPSMQAGQPATLLDYPITENEDLPAAAAESNSVLFGNFARGYTIYDVVGIRVLRDPFTNKPYVHFYTTKRVGGIVTDSLAIKVLRLGNGV